jgi:hypothetical protein
VCSYSVLFENCTKMKNLLYSTQKYVCDRGVRGGGGGGPFLKNAKLNVINPEVRRTQNDEFISSTRVPICVV